MALIICGHPRSGTTLLRALCVSHPQIVLTGEFGNFSQLDVPPRVYRRFILRNWWRARNRPYFSANVPGYDEALGGPPPSPLVRWAHKYTGIHFLQNLVFCLRFLSQLPSRPTGLVDVTAIDTSLHRLFPDARMVGDKNPDYVFSLDRLAPQQGLDCVVVYRDPRDMTSSVLKMARSARGKWWSPELQSPRRVAQRWVTAMRLLQRHRDRVYAIRYEDLIAEPRAVLNELARRLDVDPNGFSMSIIRPGSVGKHHNGLNPAELEIVLQVAGPLMQQLGYSLEL